jgi:hypothetical protein
MALFIDVTLLKDFPAGYEARDASVPAVFL